MKKIIISVGLCLGIVFAAAAQDLTSENPALVNKRGISLLPEAGDFAIGVEATPFLEYLGNFFNGSNSNDAPVFNGVDNKIYGKYFLDNDRAIRAKLRLNFYENQNKGTVANDTEVTNNPLNSAATIVDVQRLKTQDVDLYIGYEFRRGHGRVQGFYGAEVGFGYGGGKAVYEYGNEMTLLNQTPSSMNFGANIPVAGGRVTESKFGTELRASVAGFVGVEYFFAPQISIGGELNLGFVYSTLGQTENVLEQYDAASNQIQTIKSRSRDNSDLAGTAGVQTKYYGNIFLMFHF